MNRFQPAPLDVTTIDLDGFIDERGIRYIGQATRHESGTWRVLADVGGALCLVEIVTIYTLARHPTSGPAMLH